MIAMASVPMDLREEVTYTIGNGRSAIEARLLPEKSQGIFSANAELGEMYVLRMTSPPYSQFPLYATEKGYFVDRYKHPIKVVEKKEYNQQQ